MELILIHGNGSVAALNKIREIKKNFDSLSITEVNGKKKNFAQVVDDVLSPQLFFEKRLVILEEFDDDISFEKISGDDALTLVIKFSKSLPASSKVLKSVTAQKGKVFLFSEEQETNIFPFLDLLAEKKKISFNQLDSLIDELSAQYLLTMIFYLFRRMIISNKKSSPFMQKKITEQKKNFSIEKIAELYKEALETDFKLKNGLVDEKTGLSLLINSVIS